MISGGAVAFAQTDPAPVELVSAIGSPNSCASGTPNVDITVRFNNPGEITVLGQAFTELYNSVTVVGPTSGGGQLFNTVIDPPTLPDNTLVSFTISNGNPEQKVGVTINCTTGEVFPGGFLDPDGRLDLGDDLRIVVYPRLDRQNRPFLDFYRAEGEQSRRGRLVLRLNADRIAAVPERPTQNTLIAGIDNGAAELYRLTDGRFQLNFAPDAEGKVRVVTFNGIPPTLLTRTEFQSATGG
jgi:hypothetical protein